MRISIEEAEGQLTELIELANQGQEIVLMQDGQPSARLEPVIAVSTEDRDATRADMRKPLRLASETNPLSPTERAKRLREIQEGVRRKHLPMDTDAARSQDFLYDEDGMPG
ncbi:MAG: type II toxin-antitoxin system prevent-host-death family antitoxin [Pseudomonadota bacterium]|nr:type II toxin-antitoxin system prevent-host-death family antitoxin [Pseudomonadota bacterium]